MKIAIAQLNPTVGDIDGNVEKIIKNIKKAKSEKADLVLFPELSVTGYPPKDLLYKSQFLKDNKTALEKIIVNTQDIHAILGFVDYENSKQNDGREKKYNAAAFIGDKKLIGIQHKTLIPTYDVFDESRYFSPAEDYHIFELNGIKIGVQICEDLWDDNYDIKVTEILAKDADLIVNISASPFEYGKRFVRKQLLSKKARKYNVPMIYVNQVGGQDDLVFDGESMIINSNGDLVAISKKFEEDFLVFDLDEINSAKKISMPYYSEIQEIHDALVLGVKDYLTKNVTGKAVIGISGGIDSAVTTAIAVEALGKGNVVGLLMPSEYSSEGSIKDGKELCRNLGIVHEIIPISAMFNSYKKSLGEVFKGIEEDVTEENIQARIRGNMLMAYSNKFGHLVLSTGNKSEMAVGYCTLYGDMSGGFSILSDVLKTKVYELAKYINWSSIIIPKDTITKAPSAELKPDQVDQDSLPEYEILDGILEMYIEKGKDKKDIIKKYRKEDVDWVLDRVDKVEYKRRQAPPGIKITEKAFGTGRQMPIVNKYRG